MLLVVCYQFAGVRQVFCISCICLFIIFYLIIVSVLSQIPCLTETNLVNKADFVLPRIWCCSSYSYLKKSFRSLPLLLWHQKRKGKKLRTWHLLDDITLKWKLLSSRFVPCHWLCPASLCCSRQRRSPSVSPGAAAECRGVDNRVVETGPAAQPVRSPEPTSVRSRPQAKSWGPGREEPPL